jgi:ankyrin repeat protein
MASMSNLECDEDRRAECCAQFVSAAERGDVSFCSEIVAELGPNEVVDDSGRTMLMVASASDRFELCRHLLDEGALADVEDEEGRTALFMGAGGIEILRLLLEHGADATIEWHGDEEGEVFTVLDLTARRGYGSSTRMILDMRPSIDTDAKVRAMLVAAKHGRTKVLDEFFEFDPDAARSCINRMLASAAESGALSTCESLVQRGGARDSSDALILAALNGRDKVFQFFADRGANVNAMNSDGYTALHAAATSGSVDIVSRLIERGADVNASRAGSDWTPMCALAQFGYFDAVEIGRMLVAAGADVSTPSSRINDLTPFQHAVSVGRTELIEFFIDELKENLSQKCRDGRTLTELISAATPNRDEVALLLHSRMTGQAVLAGMSSAQSECGSPTQRRSMPSL